MTQPGSPPPPTGYGPPPTPWPQPAVPPPPRSWPGLRPDGSTRGPSLWLSLSVIGLGLIVAMIAIVGVVDRTGDFSDYTPLDVPGEVTVDLDEGEWRLYRNDEGGSVIVESIDVDGPASVRLRAVDSTDGFRDTRNFGRDSYTEIAAFDIDESGAYTFAVGDGGSGGTDLVVARSTLSLFGSAVAIGGWALLGVVAGLILLIGAVLLIFSLVNRSKAKTSRAQIDALR